MNFKNIFLLVCLLALSSSWAAGTWSVKLSRGTPSLKSISCRSASYCVAVGGTEFLTMVGNDNNWPSQSLSNRILTSVALSGTSGYITTGDNLSGAYTEVGGEWNVFGFLSKCNSMGFKAVQIVDGQVILSGKRYYSSFLYSFGCKAAVTGGDWTEVSFPGGGDEAPMYFVTASSGYIILGKTIYKTTNGGTNWSQQTISSNVLHSVHFANISTGYAVGNGGSIYKTIDSGANWTAMQGLVGRNLNAVHFIDARTGYAVGDSGTILETVNGGTTWNSPVPVTTANLRALSFVGDGSTGYAVGDSGTILKLTGGTPVSVASRKVLNPDAGIRRIGNRWYGFSMPDGRAFDAQGRQAPIK
jgi:hypothetical protein